MHLTVASYNIHKAVGADGKRDADRVMRVLHELDADVVALQEADRRFGEREGVLPRALLDEAHWQVAPVAMRTRSMGWHGNALLVRRGIDILDAGPIALPTLEPRGAVRARLSLDGREFCVAGMHLDLSGLLRRRQIAAVCTAMLAQHPCVLLGDLNEWSALGGALRAFGAEWDVLNPGRSFPVARPLAALDRVVVSASHWTVESCTVHHSALAVAASDHLPVKAALRLIA
ncbi:MAG: endonuclease/exonuclease/phosphatase family protein [Alteraurantiacibacter sp.]